MRLESALIAPAPLARRGGKDLSLIHAPTPKAEEADRGTGDPPLARPAKRRKGGGLYFASTLISQGLALLRYIVLARLLGPEQLGIAATLVVTASLFDLMTDMGSDRFLVQDREGDTAQVQKLVQAVSVGRGLVIAAAMAAFAVPIAAFYQTPKLAAALATLALSPLIGGFIHLDNKRAQREHDFRPEAITYASGEAAGFLVTIIAAWLTRDFTAVLYGTIARSVVIVATSQLQAKRTYGLGWDREHGMRLARFAAPLMLNGLMVYLASQGDRLIVGHELGVKALGYYSAVMLLIYYPSYVLGRYMMTMNIPLIAARRDDTADRERVIDEMGGQTLLLTVGMAVGFAMVAPVVVPMLFGHRFAQSALLIAMIGCLQTTRFALNWPTTVALATGRSATVLLSNLAHGFAFAGAYLGLRTVGGAEGLVGGFVAGEVIAVGVALARVNQDMGRPWTHRFDRLAACLAAYALVIASNLALGAGLSWAIAAIAPASAGLATWLYFKERLVIANAIAFAGRAFGNLQPRLGRS